MSIIIRNNLDEYSDINKNTSNNSFLSKMSEIQSSNSRVLLKEKTCSDINSIKNRNKTKKIFSRFKIDQMKSNQEPTFKKNYTKYSAFRRKSNKFKSNIIISPEKFFSMKALEKIIQQKIVDISLTIEKESSLLREKSNKTNISLFIKRKLGMESDYEGSSFISKNNVVFRGNEKNKSFSQRKMISVTSPTAAGEDIPQDTSLILKKFRKKRKKKDKFRVLLKKPIVYDSFDSDEAEELDQFFISPNNPLILILDSLIIISTIFNSVYNPFYLSNIKCFCSPMKLYIKTIYYFIDLLYLIDLIISFFRAYLDFQFQLIKNNTKIIKHYLNNGFFMDFIQAIPFYSYINEICKHSMNFYNCKFNMKSTQMILILCSTIKQLKLFKILNIKRNSIFYKINIFVSKKDSTEKALNFIIYFSVCFFSFYTFISLHIFIGKHSYPNWIIKSNSQDKSLSLLYLTSFYYLITTMTTVGYGDIVCGSFTEIIFQLVLLSAGISVYSFVVSSLGNYVKNESHASMKFDKDEAILEEIRISYPNMPFKLYKQIFHHLSARKIRQQHCDSNILINSLPYSLKNQVLLAIYQPIIKNFKIFKGYQNSDFTLRLLTNFIPLFSRKNALLIHEGQLIESIIFVKEGRLSLEASISIDEPGKSVIQYLNKNFIDINEDVVIISNYDTSFGASKYNPNNYQNYMNRAKIELDTAINYKTKTNIQSSMNESNIGKELGKWDLDGELFEESNYQFINIISISKNESFGSVYMFLSKPSPLSLRVKSKKAELLLLRKNDVSDISKRYPNIWAKFFKKSYLNMLSIKTITLHKIKHYWKNLGKELFNGKRLKKVKIEEFNEDNNINNNANNNNTQNNMLENNLIENNKNNPEIKGPIINIKEYSNTNRNGEMNTNIKKNNLIINNKKPCLNQLSFNSLSCKNNDSNNKYISFGKETISSKRVSFNNTNNSNKIKNEHKKNRNSYCFITHLNIDEGFDAKRNYNNSKFNGGALLYKNKTSYNKKISSLINSKIKSSIFSKKKISSLKKKRSIQNLRIDFIKKLNKKIKKLKKSKKYYKDLCKKIFAQSQNPINELDDNNKNNEIIEYDDMNNNQIGSFDKNVLAQKFNIINVNKENIMNKISPDISISLSSDESTSLSKSRTFKKEDLSITSVIQFMYNSRYKNLDKYSLGEYSKNRNLRLNTLKFIQFYMMNFPKRKKDNIYETIFSSIKSFNSSSIDHELSPSSGGFSHNFMFNFHKKDSMSPTKRKSINIDEKQYSIIYDEIKNKFNLIKQYQSNFSNSRGSKKLKATNSKKQTIQSIENAKNQHLNDNNFLKKPTKSLFNISKSLSKSLRQNDDTINEWENDLNCKRKISKDLEIFKNSCRLNTLEENINGKINNNNNNNNK